MAAYQRPGDELGFLQERSACGQSIPEEDEERARLHTALHLALLQECEVGLEPAPGLTHRSLLAFS